MEILNKTRNQVQLARILAVVIGCIVTIIATKVLFGGVDMTNPIERIEAVKSLSSVVFAYVLGYFVLVRIPLTAKERALKKALHIAYSTGLRSIPATAMGKNYGRYVKDNAGIIHYIR